MRYDPAIIEQLRYAIYNSVSLNIGDTMNKRFDDIDAEYIKRNKSLMDEMAMKKIGTMNAALTEHCEVKP